MLGNFIAAQDLPDGNASCAQVHNFAELAVSELSIRIPLLAFIGGCCCIVSMTSSSTHRMFFYIEAVPNKVAAGVCHELTFVITCRFTLLN